MFIILFFIAIIPAYIAKQKGRSFLVWYFYGIALWIVALFHAIYLKPYEDINVASGQDRKCPYCAEYVKVEAKICKYCRSELPVLTDLQKKVQQELATSSIRKKNKTGSIIVSIIVFIIVGMFILLTSYIFFSSGSGSR